MPPWPAAGPGRLRRGSGGQRSDLGFLLFFDLFDGKVKSMQDVLQGFLGFVKQIAAQVASQLAVQSTPAGCDTTRPVPLSASASAMAAKPGRGVIPGRGRSPRSNVDQSATGASPGKPERASFLGDRKSVV